MLIAFFQAKEKRLDNVGLSEGLLEMCQSYIGENNVKSSKVSFQDITKQCIMYEVKAYFQLD